MPHHFTKNTVEASAWCKICKKRTPHRVDADEMQGRLGPCLVCLHRQTKDAELRKAIAAKPDAQRNLF